MTSRIRRATAWFYRLMVDRQGQDLIEYALMASAVAGAAGATMPPVTDQISTIFSKITSLAARTPNLD
jgi:Flp pilus assembly pilin Flp